MLPKAVNNTKLDAARERVKKQKSQYKKPSVFVPLSRVHGRQPSKGLRK